MIKHSLRRLVRTARGYLGLEQVPSDGLKPWDRDFLRWIAEAEATGKDPNDIGDSAWSGSRLEVTERHYLPHITAQSVVLELGPGTGRVTRYVIGRCREMILVDYSPVVCEWLPKYLAGKGRFRVQRIAGPAFPDVDSASVDVAIANGVFHHIDTYATYFFLEEFHRVLRPGGVVSFDFVQLVSAEGREFFKQWRPAPGSESIFRFHHPDVIGTLAELAGFEIIALTSSTSRLAFLEARKR